MQSKLDQARRLCTALDLILVEDDGARPAGESLTDRSQVIVDRLVQLAADPSVRKALRASIGAGIIWQSPFGPLRFEVAYPLMQAAYDETEWFRFSVGTRF